MLNIWSLPQDMCLSTSLFVKITDWSWWRCGKTVGWVGGCHQSVLISAAVCWGWSLNSEHRNKFNKLIKKAGSIIDLTPDSLEVITEGKIVRIRSVDLMYYIVSEPRNSFSDRLDLSCPWPSVCAGCIQFPPWGWYDIILYYIISKDSTFVPHRKLQWPWSLWSSRSRRHRPTCSLCCPKTRPAPLDCRSNWLLPTTSTTASLLSLTSTARSKQIFCLGSCIHAFEWSRVLSPLKIPQILW